MPKVRVGRELSQEELQLLVALGGRDEREFTVRPHESPVRPGYKYERLPLDAGWLYPEEYKDKRAFLLEEVE